MDDAGVHLAWDARDGQEEYITDWYIVARNGKQVSALQAPAHTVTLPTPGIGSHAYTVTPVNAAGAGPATAVTLTVEPPKHPMPGWEQELWDYFQSKKAETGLPGRREGERSDYTKNAPASELNRNNTVPAGAWAALPGEYERDAVFRHFRERGAPFSRAVFQRCKAALEVTWAYPPEIRKAMFWRSVLGLQYSVVEEGDEVVAHHPNSCRVGKIEFGEPAAQ